MTLKLYLLGDFRTERAGKPLTFRTNKVRALLAYLAIEANRPHSRHALATLLWSEQSDTKALTNLRLTLSRVRQTLGTQSSLLALNQQTITFKLSPPDWVDAVEFDTLLQHCEVHPHANITACAECVARLMQAVALYRGSLLCDLKMDDSPAFDEWLALQAEPRQRRVLATLSTLATHHLERGDYTQAQSYARRQIALEAWREEGHRQLMLALHLSGQTSAALAQYETCRHILRKELDVEPSAALQQFHEQLFAGQDLQGFLLRQASSASGDMAATLAGLKAPRHNLPAALTTFIGRESEVEQLVARLANPQYRLISLVGVGGVGKTRLALQVCREVAAQRLYADGLWWCELGSVTDPALVPSALVNALGLHEPSQQLSVSRLQAHLKARHALLVFDTCEHLLAACAHLAETLLKSCDQLTIITTSLEPLGLIGELVWRVSPLAVPPFASNGQRSVFAAEVEPGTLNLEQYAAVRLFVDRASLSQPTFALHEANALKVAQLCVSLDGLPLALELAAVRLLDLPLEAIAQGLDQRFALLTKGSRAAASRQQSLQAMVAWSYDLLSESERAFLRRLAVLAGSWEAEASAALWREQHPSSAELLAALVNKSVVVRQEQQGLLRYQLLDTIRDFAREQLAQESVEAMEAWRRAHAYYAQQGDVAAQRFDFAQSWQYYGLATKCLKQLLMSRKDEALRGATLENVAASSRALSGHEWKQLPADEMLQRLELDMLFKQLRVGFSLETPQAQLARLQAAEQVAAVLAQTGQAADILRLARARLWLGRTHFYLGNLAETYRYCHQVLPIAQAHQDTELLALSASIIGANLTMQGQCAQAVQWLSQAVRAWEQMGDRYEWSMACFFFSMALTLSGQLVVAWQYIEQGLSFAHAQQYQRGLSLGQFAMTFTAFHSRDYERTRQAAQATLDLSLEVGLWLNAINALSYRAWAESRLGHHAVARQTIAEREALKARVNMRLQYAEDWRLAIDAELALNAGEHPEAINLAKVALEAAAHVKGVFTAGLAQRVWGEALVCLQPPRYDEAEAHLLESLQCFAEGEACLEVARTRMMLGRLYHMQERREAARAQFAQAAIQFEASGMSAELQQVRTCLATLAL